MSNLNPCPKCGYYFIARGMTHKIGEPMVARVFKSIYKGGFTCVNCGYYAPTARKWNRRAE